MPTVPLVGYLVLGPRPHLVANECTTCGARYFGRRSGCASCAGTEMRETELPAEGTVKTFTIVHAAAPGIKVPFVAAIIDVGGTSVRANIVDVEPSPQSVRLDMPVELTTYPIAVDANGVEAIGFGFRPKENSRGAQE